MATDLATQAEQYYQQQLQTLQAQYNSANQNSYVQSWGGSSADHDHWVQVMNQFAGAMNTLRSQHDNVMSAINSGAIDPTKMQTIQQALNGDSTAMESLNEAVAGKQQLDTQNKQLSDFQTGLIQQDFGTTATSLNNLNLADAMTSTAGSIGQLNSFLGQQEGQTFNQQLKPLIQMALGSQGLSDSGAQVELQSKALAQLEQQRQQSMMQAALGAQNQIQGVQRSDLLGGIGLQQQTMNNQFDMARTGITMQFQQQLENQREQLAQQLASYGGSQGGGGIGSMIGMGIGGAAGFAMGGPGGAMMGASMGSMLGGGIGNAVSPGQSGNGPNMAGSLMAGSSFFQNQPKPTAQPIVPYPTQNGQYSGPMNNSGYGWAPSY